MKEEYELYNELISSSKGDDVYIDYLVESASLTDEEILEKIDTNIIERFLRKKKLKNIENK